MFRESHITPGGRITQIIHDILHEQGLFLCRIVQIQEGIIDHILFPVDLFNERQKFLSDQGEETVILLSVHPLFKIIQIDVIGILLRISFVCTLLGQINELQQLLQENGVAYEPVNDNVKVYQKIIQ